MSTRLYQARVLLYFVSWEHMGSVLVAYLEVWLLRSCSIDKAKDQLNKCEPNNEINETVTDIINSVLLGRLSSKLP